MTFFHFLYLVAATCQIWPLDENQNPNLNITYAHNSPTEKAAGQQLLNLFATYPDMVKWVYTKNVIIDDSTWIPHSHPVLTINTEFLNADDEQLATFVHEQLHWLEDARGQEREKAIEELQSLYPKVPVRGGQGARNEYSTYLHLIVCDLEFQALTLLIGEQRSRDLLSNKGYYRWIYDKVLNDRRIRKINQEHGFILD